MMFNPFLLAGLLTLGAWADAAGQQPAMTYGGFSEQRAMQDLQVLAGEIGPRPMGSPAERRAMAYALRQLKLAGCRDTFFMPMNVAANINTASGIAVGVLPGATGRIIVIGGHMDSAGPDIPGANDNGSGAACVLEVARVLCQRPHHSTILFCLWGGEEEGLRGSQFFVDHYPAIDSVALMLQLDMVDGAGVLTIDPDGPYQVSGPRWLVDAAYDVFYREMHFEGLEYPVQFSTLNASGSGATGSDHSPFLVKGIPAIDFTSDIDYPIHTPLDNLQNFTPTGFARAGVTTVRLAEMFDEKQPSATLEQYLLVQVGTIPLFIPPWFLMLVDVGILVGSLAVLVWFFLRERGRPIEGRVRWSGLKLLLVTIILNIAVWLSPHLPGLLNGYRHPWATHWTAYVFLGAVTGLLGLAASLAWLNRVRISDRVAPLFLRAIIIQWILVLGLTVLKLEITIFPALVLGLLTAAVAVRRAWLGFVLYVFAVVLGWYSLFGEGTALFARMLSVEYLRTLPEQAVYQGAFFLVGMIFAPTFVYGGAAVVRAAGRDFLGLRRLGSRRGIAATAGAVVVVVCILALIPPYDAKWQPRVNIDESWSSRDSLTTLMITSSERMKGLQIHWDGRDTLLGGATHEFSLAVPPVRPADWCRVTANDSIVMRTDSTVTLARTLTIDGPRSPLQLVVRFEGAHLQAASPLWSQGIRRPDPGVRNDRRKTFTWYSFPALPLSVPVLLTMPPGERVKQTVEATYDTVSTALTVANPGGYLHTRFVLTLHDSLKAPGGGVGLASGDVHP